MIGADAVNNINANRAITQTLSEHAVAIEDLKTSDAGLAQKVQILETQIETQRLLLIKAADLMAKNSNVMADQGQAILAMGDLLGKIKATVVP